MAIVSPYALDLPGGVQRQALGLAAALHARGHHPRLIGPGHGAWIGVGRPVGVSINGSRAPIALAPSVRSRVVDAVAEADVVHVHEPFVPVAGLAALGSGRPTVATFHADPSHMVRRAYRVASPLIRRMLDGVDVTAVSPVAASAIEAAGMDAEIVPNAVDAPPVRAGRRSPHRVVFVGRDEPRKGLAVLLRSWPEVRANVADAELVVVGAGGAPQAGVRFLGRVDERPKWEALTSATVGVAPNLGGESFGIVVAEMLRAGLAVVGSDLAAFRHVTDGAALLVPPGDASALSEALIRVLSDEAAARSLRRQGQEVAERYGWDRVVERYLGRYRAAVALR